MSEAIVDVVAGILIRDDRILLQQRQAGRDFSFTWECPGGKVEASESHHEAIQREWWEELRLRVLGNLPKTPCWSDEFHTESARRPHIRLSMYEIPEAQVLGDIQPMEHQGYGWFTVHEMRRITLSPGNNKACATIRDILFGIAPGSMKPIASLSDEEVRREIMRVFAMDPGLGFDRDSARQALRLAEQMGERQSWYTRQLKWAGTWHEDRYRRKP